MLKELKFVQGAVAKKDLLPAMTHFRIQHRKVRSYNGTLALCSPIALDIDCCPKAVSMIKAIASCTEATVISLTPSGKLHIRSGKQRHFIETINGETPHVEPEGDQLHFDGESLLAAFRVLDGFTGTDASRPWTNGILLHGQSAFATNNTCMVQYWLGATFPHIINIPRDCIDEILRIGEPPTHGQINSNSITFHYTDGRWIRSQLLQTNWPMDTVMKLLDQPSNPVPLPDDFFTGLAIIRSVADGASRVYLKDGAFRTHAEAGEQGAVYEIDLPAEGLYNLKMLSLLEGVVNTIDLSLYPGPALFFGERIRGAIIGMRM